MVATTTRPTYVPPYSGEGKVDKKGGIKTQNSICLSCLGCGRRGA